MTILAPSHVPAGSSATFTAQVNNATGPFKYSWEVFSQAFPAGYAITRYFPGDCNCSIAVTVTKPGTSSSGTKAFELVVGNPYRTATGAGLGTSSATGSGSGGAGTGRGGNGGGANTGGTKGATQPKPAPKPAVRPPAPVAQPGAAAKAATAHAAAAGQPVRGILLADIGSPLDLHLSPPPPSGSPGAAHKSAGGSSGIAALLGGIALALVIVGLGGLAERRRVTLRLA